MMTPQLDPSKAGEFSDKDFAAIIRDMIRHEDSVLNQRLSWCVQIEGLLMASLAFAWEKAPNGFIYVVCFAGIFVSLSTVYASTITVNTMINLTESWKQRIRDSAYNGPAVIGREAGRWSSTLRPSRAIPGIFFFVWVLVAVIRRWFS